ncbi:MAG TPA: hypothetical protein VH415_13355 [Nitrososphaeraceae archaeon]
MTLDFCAKYKFRFRSCRLIKFMSGDVPPAKEKEEEPGCENCGLTLEECMCACPYCGERNSCECCLFDAATGG